MYSLYLLTFWAGEAKARISFCGQPMTAGYNWPCDAKQPAKQCALLGQFQDDIAR